MTNDAGSEAAANAASNARALRTRKGWSLSQAAKAAGLGKSTLAQLESGTANPSLETLWAVARAYEVPVGSLIGSVHSRSRVIRGSAREPVRSESHDYRVQLLLSLGPLNGLDVTFLETEPGEPRVSRPHAAGTIEHVFVVAGSLRITPSGADPEDLEVGDLISFPGGAEHTYETLKPGTKGLVVMQYL